MNSLFALYRVGESNSPSAKPLSFIFDFQFSILVDVGIFGDFH